MIITALIKDSNSSDRINVNWRVTPKQFKDPHDRIKYGSTNDWVLNYVEKHRGIPLMAFITKPEP